VAIPRLDAKARNDLDAVRESVEANMMRDGFEVSPTRALPTDVSAPSLALCEEREEVQ
jgi:hypothetical protein